MVREELCLRDTGRELLWGLAALFPNRNETVDEESCFSAAEEERGSYLYSYMLSFEAGRTSGEEKGQMVLMGESCSVSDFSLSPIGRVQGAFIF